MLSYIIGFNYSYPLCIPHLLLQVEILLSFALLSFPHVDPLKIWLTIVKYPAQSCILRYTFFAC